ncbi:MAG: Deoxyguanosinetriphosphate triphosphohydrolase [Polyangiaceae bacterium]|jgi:HD superfamily phosphohydrolase|nr:Deoxyguanosinetriphosphate triphosphohydrolase [Polyangiaceae bacterium]
MILRDPVHGLVSFEAEEESIVPALLQARELQRLRRVRQTGLASLAYPGADHTRFAHAIGSACVMTKLVRRLRSIHDALPYWQRLTTERARDALAAALLHDVGHGPFSHLFEQVLPQARLHEEWTREIVLDPSTDVSRILRRFDSTLPERVADLVQGKHELTFLAKAVSGTFDVDRCDYLLRDAHATGVSYGAFDLDWLLRSLRFGVPTSDKAPPLAIDGAKGIPAIESFLLARLFMFQQVYFHKTERASEWMLSRILERVGQLTQDGTRVEATPTAIRDIALGGHTSLGQYLKLDDAALWVALASWCESTDPLLSDLCQRFYARNLFKTYELFGEQATPAARLTALEVARDIAREFGLDPAVYVGLDAASTVAFDDSEDPLTVVFPNGKSRALSDVSFLLGRLRSERMERVRIVFAPELRDQIVAAFGKERS